jgi:type 1 glutamine amidotransferase
MQRALIVWGGWEGHKPRECAEILADLLREDGFEVMSTNDLTALGGPDIEAMDLVIPLITNAEIADDVVDRLTLAVKAGTALAGPHAAMATSFRRSVRFQFLTGVQWVAHPGNIIDFRVDIARPDDPVMHGITDFDYRSEQYYLHYDPLCDVLATTTFTGQHESAVAGVVMPVVFKRRFGKGRQFYTALGHTPEELYHPQGRTILRRGLSWAARREDERNSQ